MSHERVVELHRQPGIGFGFSVIGGCDTHIPHMICALVRDSPALVSGQVFVGDVLHKVNGINLYELQTKQVVDLIRGCKDKITLTLKEDRLAKLKARPFLADDTLIEPLHAIKDAVPSDYNYIKQTQVSSSYGRNNSLDNSVNLQSPNISFSRSFDVLNSSINSIVPNKQSIPSTKNQGSRPYSAFPGDRVLGESSRNGVDGRFTRLQSHEESSYVTNNIESPSSPKKSSLLAQSFGIPSPIMNRSKSTFNYVTLANNKLEVDGLKRTSPDNLCKHENNLQAISQHNTYAKKHNGHIRNEYKAEKISYQQHLDDLPSSPRLIAQKNPPDNLTSPLLNHNEINNLKINESNKSPSPHNLKKQPFVYIMPPSSVSNSASCTPQVDNSLNEVSKPVQRRISNIRPCSSSDVDQIPQSLKVESFQSNNFSSPNVFENDNERIGSEQKKLTLTPYTHPALSLQDINKQFIFCPQQSSSSRVCPTFEPSPDLVNSKHVDDSLKTSDVINNIEISPLEIASRLYTLNGYKDTDVAPMLGKNTELSQQICKEYLQFYRFDGLSLDGALRNFLGNFPLTGETQERERILIQFTKRYMECNSHCDMSEDAVHTLVCSLMLLNTDLHGHGVTNRMTLNDFVNNLSGLCDGKDFPRDQLKTLYNSIKSKKMVFASSAQVSPSSSQGSPKHKRLNSSSGNPYIELKIDSKDKVICEGLLNRKSVMDPGGRRTPAMKRNWRQFYCLLKGIILLFYKHDSMNDVHSVGIHHALAGYAKDYKKRAYVFKIIAADWSVYYIQAKNQDDVRQWMDCINVAAAMLSSPPLPAPVSSSMRFQRPVMPVSKAKLTKEQQLQHHNSQIKSLEEELSFHTKDKPDIHDKHYLDWENKLDYLEFEAKRFRAYCSVLTSSRLENIRQSVLASLSNDNDNLDDQNINKNVE
ncbi:PH and SEC7 domain-containing protein 4 isoform X1 [Hydra vulgaris]|nr:PH and SEC7 domain-containing protein 4 [Hydra vulgaris]